MYQIYQRLPAELIDAIIDASARNMKTLLSLSLISKNYVPRCRTHIFRSVRFSTDRGEGVLASRYENFLAILARDPRIQTYIRELFIEDETDPLSWASLPWIVTNTRFHQTLSLVGSRLEKFGFTVGYHDWNTLPTSLKLPLMSIFTSPTLKAITLAGLDNIPRACCIAIGSHIQRVEMLRTSFSDRVDPDLAMVEAISTPPSRLEWLSLEDVDSESINILLDAWIPAPTQGDDRPLFPCLRTLCIGPTDDDEVGPLWELARAGSATLTRFLWEYFGGTRLVEPTISEPLNLSTLKKLREISYEVTAYSSYGDDSDEDEPVPTFPDYFSGLLSLLQTIERGHDIQQVFIRFNFFTLSDAVKSLNEHDGWGRLNSVLESDCFDHLHGLTLHLDVETTMFDDKDYWQMCHDEDDSMSVDIDLQEKKRELEALIKKRIPTLVRYLESDPEAFMLMVEGGFAD